MPCSKADMLLVSTDVCDSFPASRASREAETEMWGEETALAGEEAEPLPPQHYPAGTSCANKKPSLVSSQTVCLAWKHALFPRRFLQFYRNRYVYLNFDYQ